MDKNYYKINLKMDRDVINILGEICWGLRVDNFEKKIGVRKEIVETLLKRLLKEEKAGVTETYFSAQEVELIKTVLQEVEKEIEEWEFQTRIGISIDEAKKIKEKLE